MSTPQPAPAWARPHRNARVEWAVLAGLVVLAIVVGLVLGQFAAGRLHVHRYGDLRGTSPMGEWVDFSEFGFKARLDEAEAAETMPSRFGGESTAEPGMVLVRVKMTIEFTVDLAVDNYTDMVTCDLALWNAAGERINYLGPYDVAGPEAVGCYALPKPYAAGELREIQSTFQVRPDDLDGLLLELTTTDMRVESGGTWPTWRFPLDF